MPSERAVTVLLAVSAAVVLVMLVLPALYLLTLTPRIRVAQAALDDAANNTGIPGAPLGASSSSCAAKCLRSDVGMGQAVWIFQVAVIVPPAPPTGQSNKLLVGTSGPARALAAAIRCGSIDTLAFGPWALGLTGHYGIGRRQVWIGIQDATDVPPLDVSPSVASAMAHLQGQPATMVPAILIGWRTGA